MDCFDLVFGWCGVCLRLVLPMGGLVFGFDWFLVFCDFCVGLGLIVSDFWVRVVVIVLVVF